MARPRRRNARSLSTQPDALAAQLPEALRAFQQLTDPDDFTGHARRVAEWLNTQQPGLGYLTGDVMRAAGLTASAWFRVALSLPAVGPGPIQEGLDRASLPVTPGDLPEPAGGIWEAVPYLS